MNNLLYVAWQDPAQRRWYPIGILSDSDGVFSFRYTQGALDAKQHSNFRGLQSFPDLDAIYESQTLFPVFRSRLLSANRPEYKEFIHWLDLSDKDLGPIAILARSGGRRETDKLEVFPRPTQGVDGTYRMYFFVHGIRHVSGAEEKVKELKTGDRLVLTPEPENKFDKLALRLDKDGTAIGYCPRYVNSDFGKFLAAEKDDCVVSVERVNLEPVPIQFRLLCKFETAWKLDFSPFDEPAYNPIKSLAPLP